MSVVKNLNLKVDENLLNENPDFVENPVLRAVKHYENQTSIKKEIKRNVDKRNFSFSFAFFTDNKQQLKNLNPKKASQDADIPPTRILKENSAQFVLKNNNEAINTSTIPNILEYANVKPGYERDSRNYRPMSILSNLSKVYEKCLFNEMASHFDNILSNYQCGFKKGFSSQQCV